MQATLIYNPRAGNVSRCTPDEIMDALRTAGFDPLFFPTVTEEDLDRALVDAKDLVVVAGGDGSIRSAAIRLLGRNSRIVPLPLGTANNITRILGLSGKPLEIIAGLADPVKQDMDIWRVTTPRGIDYFVEAMGVGMFADVMRNYNPKEGKSLRRGFNTLLTTLKGYQPKYFHLNMDGEDFSGRYFLCEVMNTPTVGFRHELAPDARIDDGLFDLVLIHANQPASYVRFAKAVLTGTLDSLPDVSIHQGRRMEFAWRGFPLHLDGTVISGLDGVDVVRDRFWDKEPKLLDIAKPYLGVELAPDKVHFLLPGTTIR